MTCHSEEGEDGSQSPIKKGNYVASVDVGTTNLRCHIYDANANVQGKSIVQLDVLYPKQGWVEMDPVLLWEKFAQTFKDGIRNAGLEADEVSCVGITTQRGSFVTWDKETGQPFHNCILWNDIRSEALCNEWNNSFRLTVVRFCSRIMYKITRNKRYLAGSVLKYIPPMSAPKLLWVLQNIPEVHEKALNGQALFGTLDTWLLWKATGGMVHATEPSSACVTGIYDPFQMMWANWAISMLNIPPSLLPSVKSSLGEFGKTDPDVFGASIPITAMLGDQSASTFGECCFQQGDVKLTMGTGTFMHINTGSKAHASLKGIYPMVGWKIGDEVTYVAEAKSHDTGNILEWARTLSFYEDPSESSAMAKSVSDSGGVYFVPAMNGIQAPINDSLATCSFLGITAKTTKNQMVRAILEALAFRVLQMIELMEEEADFDLKYLRIDGGVAKNDFLAQLIADLTGHPVDRPSHKEMTCLGVAFMAGLATGVWKKKEDLIGLRKTGTVFQPSNNLNAHYNKAFQEWKRAVNRCLRWYPPTDTGL